MVGSKDTTAPVIEASYKRFLAVMGSLIEKQKFVLGGRPSSAEFGIYAQPTQLAKCLQWINEEYQKLDATAKSQVDEILVGTGCDSILL